MKEHIVKAIKKYVGLTTKEIERLLEVPPSIELGDYAFPCFTLAKEHKKNPVEIAQTLAKKISSKHLEKVEAKGPYINFFLDRKALAKQTLTKILKEKDKYGSSARGKNKTIVIDMSSPNIAKPIGIGHLRSTIIGNSISKIAIFLGYKMVRVNHLGDWGTPFGKIIAGYEKWGNKKALADNPTKHLYEIYVRANKEPSFDKIGREYFKKLESGDKKYAKLWKQFKDLSIKDFKKIYKWLNVEFDSYCGESFYNNKMEPVIKELEKKKLLERSDNALIVDLNKYNLGVGLIQKTDGTTLYLTRDLAAAKYRNSKYKFHRSFYEVGSEQNLHFKQLFKTLKLMNYKWAKDCVHINHGLYLDAGGKKLATRKGKTIFMQDVIDETTELAEKEIEKREPQISQKEKQQRALAIARAAIIYGDLKNFRANDMLFDINKFISFEGNTGPYLLYTYARAKSILEKADYKQKQTIKIQNLTPPEKSLITQLAEFPEITLKAYNSLAPNLIANYAFQLAQSFNEFYHSNKVIGSREESFRLALVDALSQVLKNALSLLAIETLEKM